MSNWVPPMERGRSVAFTLYLVCCGIVGFTAGVVVYATSIPLFLAPFVGWLSVWPLQRWFTRKMREIEGHK